MERKLLSEDWELESLQIFHFIFYLHSKKKPQTANEKPEFMAQYAESMTRWKNMSLMFKYMIKNKWLGGKRMFISSP